MFNLIAKVTIRSKFRAICNIHIHMDMRYKVDWVGVPEKAEKRKGLSVVLFMTRVGGGPKKSKILRASDVYGP